MHLPRWTLFAVGIVALAAANGCDDTYGGHYSNTRDLTNEFPLSKPLGKPRFITPSELRQWFTKEVPRNPGMWLYFAALLVFVGIVLVSLRWG
jgi:hypothetical protein